MEHVKHPARVNTPLGSQCILFAVVAMHVMGLVLAPRLLFAGVLVNADKQTYTYRIFWDDLSPTVKDNIDAGEKKEFADKTCTIELLKQRDNIFVRPHETVLIREGILHIQKED